MTKRPKLGRGLFYMRDSEGRSDLAPPQYVAGARSEAARLGVAFGGTPEAILEMIRRGESSAGDLFLDYAISGHILTRPGFDALRQKALTDGAVSHVFIPCRDRIARPDDPIDGVTMECDLRRARLTIVFQNKVSPPIPLGSRLEVGDLLGMLLEFNTSGEFRLELARKLIQAKVRLAGAGFTIGGEPPYGFRRWLCRADGVPRRELAEREIVKMPGHHVVWLPTAEDEIAVVRRIAELILTTPAGRIAKLLNAEKIPSPNAGRTTTRDGVTFRVSGLWTYNTVRNVATHACLVGLMQYGKRGSGDQLRFTPDGPPVLDERDFDEHGKLRSITNPESERSTATIPGGPSYVIKVSEREAILATVAERGKTQRGKPLARDDSPNPLGSRIFDLNCGWPMYRYARRGKFCCTCALYQNSESARCDHNTVSGDRASGFVLRSILQHLFAGGRLEKLRDRLRQLAAAERGGDSGSERRRSLQSRLAKLQAQSEAAARNMLVAEDDEPRDAMKKAFGELKAERARVKAELDTLPRTTCEEGPEQEVEAAMAGLDRLSEMASVAEADAGKLSELFRHLDARLYLRFRREPRGRSIFNVAAEGVLTFGASPPPIAMYEGPMDRPSIKRMIAAGESVSPVLENGSPECLEIDPTVRWSANENRLTRRCSGPGPPYWFSERRMLCRRPRQVNIVGRRGVSSVTSFTEEM